MSAQDKYHNAVKQGLQKQNWTITDDPLRLQYGQKDVVKIDLASERLLAAERGVEKIAVEVKSFLADSVLSDFHLALGQCLNYRLALQALDPDRTLYLAVPRSAYDQIMKRDLPRDSIQAYDLNIIVYDPVTEEILSWNS